MAAEAVAANAATMAIKVGDFVTSASVGAIKNACCVLG
jgi:hypothetical protein